MAATYRSRPAMRRLLFVSVLACFGGFAPAEEPAANQLRSEIFLIPPIFGRGTTDEEKASGRYDYRAAFKAHGIEISAEGEATYDAANRQLIVRAPVGILEKIDGLHVDGGEGSLLEVLVDTGRIMQVRVVLTVVEFSIEPGRDLRELAYSDARKAAGSSWRVLESCSAVAKSGQKTEAARQGPGALASKLEIEPQIGPRGEIDCSFSYHCRVARAGMAPLDFAGQNNVELEDGIPFFVQTAETSEGNKVVALIVQASLIDSSGQRDSSNDQENGAGGSLNSK